MPDDDTVTSARRSAGRILSCARRDCGLSNEQVRRVITTGLHCTGDAGIAYATLAGLTDRIMGRRPLSDHDVNQFYVRARHGHRGEKLFIGGVEALLTHGYPAELVRALPSGVADRFLGLGNVWQGVASPSGKRVIDVGCGPGVDLSIAFLLSGGDVFLTGMDKRPDLFSITAVACPSAALVIGDVSAVPLHHGEFDVVLANGLPPLQRPATLVPTSAALHALTSTGGLISATVISAAPPLVTALEEIFPDESTEFTGGLATLISGKPVVASFVSAFERLGCSITLRQGINPYRDSATRNQTATFQILAARGGTR